MSHLFFAQLTRCYIPGLYQPVGLPFQPLTYQHHFIPLDLVLFRDEIAACCQPRLLIISTRHSSNSDNTSNFQFIYYSEDTCFPQQVYNLSGIVSVHLCLPPWCDHCPTLVTLQSICASWHLSFQMWVMCVYTQLCKTAGPFHVWGKAKLHNLSFTLYFSFCSPSFKMRSNLLRNANVF